MQVQSFILCRLLLPSASIICIMIMGINAVFSTNPVGWPSNLTCYCNNPNHNGHEHRKCHGNRCMSTSVLATCYVQLKEDGEGVQLKEYGCTFSTVCNVDGENKKKKCNFHCCKTSMCNDPGNNDPDHKLAISSLRYPCEDETSYKPVSGETISKELVIVIVATPLALIIIIVMVVVMCKHFKKSNNNYHHSSLLRPNDANRHLIDLTQLSSAGSGTGVPLLSEQTIALEIVLKECVSKGKFGTVYRATWQQQNVAVKIFSTGEETSWFCEREIYHTTMLRHENILGFIAADSKDTGTCTEYWLITEYHEKGSLFNYLQSEMLSIPDMLKMICSIASGLNHLHIQIVGNNTKPPIAHRDMKTKNILVKEDNTCCIADLGLAITKSSVCQGTVNSSRTGTRRYHSPELLNDTMDTRHFESFLKADVYALGLCFWEICWRTKTGEVPQEYQLPYFDHVPVNPSEDDMLKAVCVHQNRPTYKEEWHHSPEMVALMRLMDECWCPDASARLPTLRIKKNVLQLLDRIGTDVTSNTVKAHARI